MRSVAILGVVCGLVGTAAASPPEAWIAVDTSSSPPQLRATIVGAPLLPGASITIRAETGAPIHASSVTPYRDGTDAITLAIVYSGNEIFVGNEEHEPNESARYTGVLHALAGALDTLDLTARYPAGSKAILVSYANGARIELPLGPLATLTGAAVGNQRKYRYQLGTDLVAGIELGIAELRESATPRRALIVIGDGNDTNNELAAGRLVELRKQAAAEAVSTFAVIYKTPLSEMSTVLTRMIPRAETIASPEALGPALAAITASLDDRFYVTFPLAGLPVDGRMHELTIALAGAELESVTVVLPGGATATATSCTGWWTQLGLGAILAGLLVLGMMLKARLARATAA